MKIAKPMAILLLAIILISGIACSLFSPTFSTPTPTPVPTQIIAEPTYSPDTIIRQYEWSYDGREWQWTLSIRQSLYDYYVERPRVPTEDYSIYVTHPKDDEYIDTLIDKIEEVATNTGYDEMETVNFAVSFIQSLPYAVDNVTTSYDEYPRYPIETLVDNGGDCEDTSILMAAILNEMGYGTVLLSLPNHMAVGVLGSERGCRGPTGNTTAENTTIWRPPARAGRSGNFPRSIPEDLLPYTTSLRCPSLLMTGAPNLHGLTKWT